MAGTIPANDRKASNLLFLSVAVASLPPLVWQAMGHISPYFPHWTILAILLFTLLVYVGLGVGIRAGKRWAKIMFLLYSLLNFSFLTLPPLDRSFLYLQALVFLLRTGLHGWAFLLVARDLLRRPVTGEAAQ